MEMTISRAQEEMRESHLSGAAGILASGLAWSAAAGTAYFVSPTKAVWVLFIGGMLIHPVATLICRLLGARAGHTKGNPLVALAGASTAWLIFSLPLAYGLSLQHLEWFFPAMLLVIGGRYLVFATMFGMRLYWVLGIALAAAAFLLHRYSATPWIGAASGAAIELAFAIACFAAHFRRVRPAVPADPAQLRSSN